MKIIKVLVDEMPSGCKRCNFCVAKMYCSLLEDRKTTVPDEPYKRRADCPLVYDFGDRETNALNKRIAELEEERRWIPVSERLPECEKDVLVFWGKASDGSKIDWFGTAWRNECDDGKWCTDPIVPTHWMPLPEPPEVQ